MFSTILQLRNHPHGLSERTIQQVSAYCAEHFDAPLPEGYAAFLRESNGFSYDGQSIFCCYNEEIRDDFPGYTGLDLVTFNTRFYESTDITSYLMLGKSSLDYLCYEKSSGKYLILSNGVMRTIAESDSLETLAKAFFQV